MQVDGVSVEGVLDIYNKSIVEGTINAAGYLILKTRGGTEYNAGLVRPPAVSAWPVGSIFVTVDDRNPEILLGGGTWVQWGRGRMIVGQLTADTDFNAAEKTGGAKRVSLTASQNGPHQHNGTTGAQNANHTHSGGPTVDGSHVHGYQIERTPRAASPGGTYYLTAVDAGTVYTTWGNGAHSHSVSVGTESTAHGHAFTTDASGTGESHENMSPYIVAYMWKRIT